MKRRHLVSLASFTLVELLTVILIIAVLAGLTLAAFSGVMKTAARSRARSEIQAIATALASYDADNGAYPSSGNGFATTNDYLNDPSPAPAYELSSEALYQAFTGQTYYGTPAAAGTKVYMPFKASQLGNITGGNPTYIKDPFGNPYGYFSGNPANAAAPPVNGANQFDLWSTGGDTTGTAAGKASWISNWGQGE